MLNVFVGAALFLPHVSNSRFPSNHSNSIGVNVMVASTPLVHWAGNREETKVQYLVGSSNDCAIVWVCDTCVTRTRTVQGVP